MLGAGLAGAADLSVTGSIRPATVCSLTLSGAGVVDLGTLSRKDLKETEKTHKYGDLAFSIHCPIPTRLSVELIDNRPGTGLAGPGWYYGLGMHGKQHIGHYLWGPYSVLGDGKKTSQLIKGRGEAQWTALDGYTTQMTPGSLTAWNEAVENVPQAFKRIEGYLELSVTLAPARDLDLGREVIIDGSSTMEIAYL